MTTRFSQVTSRLVLLIASATPLVPLAAQAQNTGGKPKPVFSCSFGAKRVVVETAGSKSFYRFGSANHADILIVGDPSAGSIHFHNELYAHSYNTRLRFTNGRYSYSLYHRWSSPDYSGHGAEDRSGLVVLDGTRIVSRLACRSGAGFAEGFDGAGLPDDPDAFDVFR